MMMEPRFSCLWGQHVRASKRRGDHAYFLRNLGEIDGNLRRGDSDADTIEKAARDERSEAIGSDLDGSPDEPPDAGKEDTFPHAKVSESPTKLGGRECTQNNQGQAKLRTYHGAPICLKSDRP